MSRHQTVVVFSANTDEDIEQLANMIMFNEIEDEWTTEEEEEVENETDETKTVLKENSLRCRPDNFYHKELKARLESFETWPVGLKQKPAELADAGLYYTGCGDRCLCFACGVELENWLPDEDVWTKHALETDKCTHIILSKGDEFVKSVKKQDDEHKIIEENNEEEIIMQDEQIVEQEKNDNEENCSSNDLMCVICLENRRNMCLVPCKHFVLCTKCAQKIMYRPNRKCPLCRVFFTHALQIYMS
ncbi:inhibitor of apoptosis 1 [Phthorimaea operculella granulovirus]|uniref:Inhibitor of apoptosis 1 n=1 Tax=Phthorimaea operculella granulovirus TaxID=192584 RepID=Q8JRX3_9BBAC|nr:inhibitor of apoptosis 1 [Phthorimaea operculella granulovirus]AAM70284.1 inhibitor of apoptosis 1 [Phthorimaea operculella granulovirus]QBH65921.1 inhibitor of apoptosis 1 [Phthorimaea operculella granulovirus]QBH66051.1 inhibitor of apoptosis 1 [Phthorimaea operculella granulovirus]QBH66181.1 inhibitor of apoptosis 1 [Phthorimaea operculella granulovirus]QBH66311.1 inhibitor of apoptosis 1 [Phthorimaea operculella granulovirus]